MMNGFWLGTGSGAAGLLGGLGSLLLLAGVVLLVLWAVGRAPSGAGQTAPAVPDPMELLRIRFARGEITEAELADATRVLGHQR
jgi:uncharacterized membrane protein